MAATMVTSTCMEFVRAAEVLYQPLWMQLYDEWNPGLDITVVIHGIGRNRVLVEWVTEVL